MRKKIKNGDYFVCLETPNSNPFILTNIKDCQDGGAGFKPNYCFKLNHYNDSLVPKGDILWSTTGGCGIYVNSVRKATKEETAEYERIGSFDVTTLISKKAIKEKDCKYLLKILKKLKLI